MNRRRVLHWTIGLVVLVVLLIGADRVAAAIAGNQAQRYLAQQAAFTQSPSVHIGGFPFLTQVIRGRYDDIEVRSAGVSLNGVTATEMRVTLHGVHLPVSAAFGRTVTSLLVDSASGSVTLTYPEVASLSGIAGLTIAVRSGQLAVSAQLAIPGTNVSAVVSGTGTARYDGTAVRLTVTGLTVAGLSVPSAVISQLEAALAVPITLPALPYGLHIDSITPTGGGLVVTGSATHALIEAG